jgi:hypothetical protein
MEGTMPINIIMEGTPHPVVLIYNLYGGHLTDN